MEDEIKEELMSMDSLTLLVSGLWQAPRDYSRRLTERGLLGLRVMLLLGFTLCGSYGKESRVLIRMKGRASWKAKRL